VCNQTAVPAGKKWKAVSAGAFFTCGLDVEGQVLCWGGDGAGQTSVPEATYKAVAAGFETACALTTDGTVACWGSDSGNQVSTAPTDTVFKSISVGRDHACGITTNDTLQCWGSNDNGESAGYGGGWGFPGHATGDLKWSSVSAGFYYTCATLLDGSKMACWGLNLAGNIDIPNGEQDGELIRWDTSLQGVSTSYYYVATTCAIKKADSSLVCWGNDDSQQVSSVPAGAFTAVSASGGDGFVCALGAAGIQCWGSNAYEQTVVPAL